MLLGRSSVLLRAGRAALAMVLLGPRRGDGAGVHYSSAKLRCGPHSGVAITIFFLGYCLHGFTPLLVPVLLIEMTDWEALSVFYGVGLDMA